MSYLSWHYKKVWPTLFLFWRNIIFFPFYLFAVPLHLRTLFSPWHRQRIHMGRGFSLSDFVNVIFFNIFSRILGASVRLLTINAGLFFMIFCLLFGALIVFVWPFLIFFSLPLYIFRNKSCNDVASELLIKNKKSSTALVISLLKTDAGKFALKRLHIEPDLVTTELSKLPDTGSVDSLLAVLKDKTQTVHIADVLFAAAYTHTPFKNILGRNGFSPHDFLLTASWYEKLYCSDDQSFLLSLPKIKSLPGIGSEWDYGYTVELDKYARDVTNTRSSYPLLIGRDKELSRIQETLLRMEGNNALIVGEPGVARHQLVETLAHRIAIGDCLPPLIHKRILELDAHTLTAAKPTALEIKGFVSSMLEEAAYAGNVILCIDDIENYLTTGSDKIDLTDVFEKFAQSSVALIGITTPDNYHRYIKPNPALDNLFDKIEVEPIPINVLMEELQLSIVPVLENRLGVYITYQALKKTIEDAEKYLSETPFPAKAIELLDASCVYVKSKKNNENFSDKKKQIPILLPEDIDVVITQKTKISIGNLQSDEKEKLAHLEDLIHARVINQETAVGSIASSLRRSRLAISSPNKPIGSFLFLGPTGVGKTETAKALAAVYFESDQNMLRFDMSQYQQAEGMQRLIGSIQSGHPGELTSALRDNPFTVLLLDEFEKSDRQIYNLFLTLLDEGYISDSTGKKVNAKNCIVIATSNAGSEFIRQQTQNGITGAQLQSALIEHVQREKIFSPEFLNRFDSVVVFTPLSEGHLREVVKLQLLDLNKRLAPKEISVKITPELVNQLVTLGYDPQFGARAIKRKIADTIEDFVAKKILAGTAKKGEEIEVDLQK